MLKKRKPRYSLREIQSEFSSVSGLRSTTSAITDAWDLGFDKAGIVRVVQSMSLDHFQKSMPSHRDPWIWQDVYHVPSERGMLYVKFTEGRLTRFLLLSFKEMGDDY